VSELYQFITLADEAVAFKVVFPFPQMGVGGVEEGVTLGEITVATTSILGFKGQTPFDGSVK
jgi:hypothetical protein